ncbi:MAG: KUP/HAK/KT family potassium transporter [Saprospiraceae bacterium]|nr:KUP/HAK/KT family potassium transporter [Saprospiraceae bacterium]
MAIGSVLCTTGAEALYSDLGHCGKTNIRISWGFVWIMLLLNYFGQSAWVLSNFDGQLLSENQRIFYALMPSWFLPYRSIHSHVGGYHSQPGINIWCLYPGQ